MAIPIAIVAFVIAMIAYGLSHRNPRIAWRLGWTLGLVLWSVATIAVVPNTHPTLCSILSHVGSDGTTIDDLSNCNRPHWPTILGYVFGYIVIAILALVTRPRAPRS